MDDPWLRSSARTGMWFYLAVGVVAAVALGWPNGALMLGVCLCAAALHRGWAFVSERYWLPKKFDEARARRHEGGT